ncbi:hypothetical protein D910_00071, partial [Dendroctonus ponderosae]
VHLRDVSVEEGAILARSLECGFTEVAASEQIAPVAVVFQVSASRGRPNLRNKPYFPGIMPGSAGIQAEIQTFPAGADAGQQNVEFAPLRSREKRQRIAKRLTALPR